MLQKLGEEIWGHQANVLFGGIPMPHQMTVIRLRNGSLLVHSPTPLTSELGAALAFLGSIDSVIAPSWWHDMYLGSYLRTYPTAALYGSPTFTKWNSKLGAVNLVTATPHWQDEVPRFYVDQMRLFLDEFVFLHRASRSLVVADLAFNIGSAASLFTRLSFLLVGAYPGCKIPWFYQLAPRSLPRMREHIERILEWDFEQLIVGHGEVIAKNGKDALRQAYAWLLR